MFNSQLEKSREATDLANIRSAYAEVIVQAIDGTYSGAKTVSIKQQVNGWATDTAASTLSELVGSNGTVTNTPQKNGTVEIAWDSTKEACTITFKS